LERDDYPRSSAVQDRFFAGTAAFAHVISTAVRNANTLPEVRT
jgi:hypothetical protein